MQNLCPYYHEHGNGNAAVPCCKHKHAPVPCVARAVIWGEAELRCEGLLARCEIPAEKQLDLA